MQQTGAFCSSSLQIPCPLEMGNWSLAESQLQLQQGQRLRSDPLLHAPLQQHSAGTADALHSLCSSPLRFGAEYPKEIADTVLGTWSASDRC